MKTIRQCKIWKKKIEYFNNAHIAEITVKCNDSLVKVLALVKGEIAIHLTLKNLVYDVEQHKEIEDKERFYSDSFTLSHPKSGLFVVHHISKNNFENVEFDQLNEKTKENWNYLQKDYIPANGFEVKVIE